MSTWEVLNSPGVPIVLFIFGHVGLLGLGYTAVSPVFMYTDIDLGGFSFSDQWIAVFLIVAGASQSLWMLLAFPPLQRRFGTGNVMRVCVIGWSVLLAFYPVLNEFLRHEWTVAFWVVGPISLILGSGVSMGYGKPAFSPCPAFHVVLTEHSMHPTLPQRHLPFLHRPCHGQCLGTHSQQRRASVRTRDLYELVCCGREAWVGGWAFDLVHLGRDRVGLEHTSILLA